MSSTTTEIIMDELTQVYLDEINALLYNCEKNQHLQDKQAWGTIMIADDEYPPEFIHKIYDMLLLNVIDYRDDTVDYIVFKGIYYYRIKKNNTLAKKYYLEAIKRGNVRAIYLMSLLNQDNPLKSKYYMDMAMANNSLDALMNLSIWKMIENDVDMEDKLKMALDMGHPLAMTKLIDYYEFCYYILSQPGQHIQYSRTLNKKWKCQYEVSKIMQDLKIGKYPYLKRINNQYTCSIQDITTKGAFETHKKSFLLKINRYSHLFDDACINVSTINYGTTYEYYYGSSDETNIMNVFHNSVKFSCSERTTQPYASGPRTSTKGTQKKKWLQIIVSSPDILKSVLFINRIGLDDDKDITPYECVISCADERKEYIRIIRSKGYKGWLRFNVEKELIDTFASEGDISAILHLAKTDKDYYLRAIELGSVYAMIQLGNWYRDNTDDHKQIVRYYEMAIARGDDEAKMLLAEYYDSHQLSFKAYKYRRQIFHSEFDDDEYDAVEKVHELSEQVRDLMRDNTILKRTLEIYYQKFAESQ